jgi:multiple sugar transport system substrate-binding protein
VRSVCLLLVLALVAVACSTTANEVTVLVAGDPQELAVYRSVVEAFRDSGGDPVRLIEVAERDELIAQLATSIAAGDPPDLFLLNYRYYGTFFAAGALEPLGPFIEGSATLDESAFFPEAMAAFRDDGVQTCLPQNVASLVVYVNRDLFREAGVAFPEGEWSWAEMVRRAEALTRDTDGDGVVDVYGLGVEPEIIRVAPLVWSAGGELVDDETDPSRLAIANVEGVRAFRAFLELRARGVTPTDEETASLDLESRFLNGGLAMLIESRKVVPTFRTITAFGWDVAPLPSLDKPANVLHSDAYCMTAGSDAKDAAWRFVEFALGIPGQRNAAEAGRTVPSLIEVARSDAFLDPSRAPAHSDVFLEQISTIRALPHVARWPEIEDVANGLIEEAYYEPNGSAEAQELVLTLVRETKPLFEDAGAP